MAYSHSPVSYVLDGLLTAVGTHDPATYVMDGLLSLESGAGPAISSVSPISGTVLGGTILHIYGSGFGAAQGTGYVLLDLASPASYVSWVDGEIVVITAAHVADTVDVSVYDSLGGSATKVNAYTFTPMTLDEAAVATVRKPVGRVTVHWGGSLLDNLVVTTAGATASNFMHSATRDPSTPNLIYQITDGVTTIAHKWFRCDGVATLDDMVLAPGDVTAQNLYQFGWWGSLFATAVTGAFTVPQQLHIKMATQAVTTVTVVGDAALSEYPVDFNVKVYSGSTGAVLEAEETITANAQVTRSVSIGPVSEATAILLTITRWSTPGAVAKICELYTSAKEVYDGDEIMNIGVLEEMELKDATLPTGNISASELELSLNNVDDKFFPANTAAVYHAMVRKNRKIVVELGFDIPDVGLTYLPMGTYWSGDWKISEDGTTADTTALNRMGRLKKMTYWTSAMYFDETVGDLVKRVLEDAKLQQGMNDLQYHIDPALYGADYAVLIAWFPKQSYFDALKTLAGACLGRAYVDRSDVIQFLAPADEGIFEYELTADDYYNRTQPEESESVQNRIEVTTQPLLLQDPEAPATATEVYRSNADIEMAVGESRTFNIEFKDRPVDNVVIAAEAGDGSAFNGTVSSSTIYAWGAEVTVLCTVAGGMRIVAEGDYYKIDGKEVVVRKSEDSIFMYGEQRYELKENALIQTSDLAGTVAGKLLETYQEPAKDVELNWRGNPNFVLGTVFRAPEYVSDTVSNKADFVVFRLKTQFDGAFRQTMSGRKVRESPDLVMQDTDSSGYDAQDTDDSNHLLIML